MLEIKNSVTEVNAFDGFISRLAMLIIFTTVNLYISQNKFLFHICNLESQSL